MSQDQHVNIPGYELVRELGVGGMAIVFLAIQTSLDRKVALKVMRRNIEDIEKFERRFLMEGRTLAKLPHRNIVAVYDIVKSDVTTYIAMEYLDGGTLHERMRDGLSLAEAVAIVVQIAGALQFAHDHGVIHRDLKPSNIMFRDESTPVLTDFGIARQQDAQQTRLTQTGMLVGTPTYMSPEQINALEVDGRSDLYSLGIMFYELLTGNAPFGGDTPIAVLMAHLTTAPPPLPAAFGEFQSIIDRMLAKNRDDRFANLKEFTKALKAVVIANETLWARLQADPNQSSSEQLRALGFSISSQTAGDLQQPHGVRRTGQAAMPSGRLPAPGSNVPTQVGGQVAGRTGERSSPVMPAAGTPTPVPQYMPMADAPPPKSRTPLMAGIGLLVAVLVAVGLWLGMRGTQEIDPKIKSRVDGLLAVVDSQIAGDKLVPPPLGDNTRHPRAKPRNWHRDTVAPPNARKPCSRPCSRRPRSR
ncbi:MAG: serine/threonine protein kinase [Ahniella sp.]|nr:serine/threonine protein kinase [Ahniella sp.]